MKTNIIIFDFSFWTGSFCRHTIVSSLVLRRNIVWRIFRKILKIFWFGGIWWTCIALPHRNLHSISDYLFFLSTSESEWEFVVKRRKASLLGFWKGFSRSDRALLVRFSDFLSCLTKRVQLLRKLKPFRPKIEFNSADFDWGLTAIFEKFDFKLLTMCDLTTKGKKEIRLNLRPKPAKISATLLKICLTAVEPLLNSSSTKSRTKEQPLLLTMWFSISNLHPTSEVEPSENPARVSPARQKVSYFTRTYSTW